jgi:hypothetical protein
VQPKYAIARDQVGEVGSEMALVRVADLVSDDRRLTVTGNDGAERIVIVASH